MMTPTSAIHVPINSSLWTCYFLKALTRIIRGLHKLLKIMQWLMIVYSALWINPKVIQFPTIPTIITYPMTLILRFFLISVFVKISSIAAPINKKGSILSCFQVNLSIGASIGNTVVKGVQEADKIIVETSTITLIILHSLLSFDISSFSW